MEGTNNYKTQLVFSYDKFFIEIIKGINQDGIVVYTIKIGCSDDRWCPDTNDRKQIIVFQRKGPYFEPILNNGTPDSSAVWNEINERLNYYFSDNGYMKDCIRQLIVDAIQKNRILFTEDE